MRAILAALVLLWACPALAQECAPGCIPVDVAQRMLNEPDHRAAVLAVTFTALSGADIAATSACAGSGRCREANPLLAGLIGGQHYGTAGAVKLGLTAGTVWAVYRWTPPRSRQRYFALGAAVVMQAAILGFNATQHVGR